jgi:hypothetical protein
MSDFYTVTIQREKRTAAFDAAGNKISDTVEWIPTTFRDLPYTTARMYAESVPAGRAEVIRQYEDQEPVRFDRNRGTNYAKAAPERVVEDGPSDHELAKAAASGDLGAAVTAELEAS